MIYTTLFPVSGFPADKKPAIIIHLMQYSAPPPLPVPSAENPSSAVFQTNEMHPKLFKLAFLSALRTVALLGLSLKSQFVANVFKAG